jgi:hypothetical protein
MVDKEASADPRPGVNLDSGYKAIKLGKQAANQS